jgi:hypothetical protein
MEEVVKLFSIDTYFALPSYSQDKGKVERCIQNLNRMLPECLKGRLSECEEWFNHSRFHRCVKTFHAEDTVKLPYSSRMLHGFVSVYCHGLFKNFSLKSSMYPQFLQ